MSDDQNLTDGLAQHAASRKQTNQEARKNFRQACQALRALGVTEVRIEYDGYGDSGAVEGITATGSVGTIEIPAELQTALTNAAEILLPNDWENDSGAFGEFVLDVANRRLTRKHNWRVETTEYNEKGWKL